MDEENVINGEADVGECMRYPPTFRKPDREDQEDFRPNWYRFPATYKGMVCGEFAPSEFATNDEMRN